MNILLTGGTGYIGSHVAVVLAQSGYKVTLLDNFSNSNRSVLDRIKKILGYSILCVEGDVRDTELVKSTLIENQINSVVHFAGLKAVGESNKIPIEYYSNNVQGTLSLLDAMKSSNVKRLVFSSSATVYGNPEYLPIDENHPLKATNPYGRTKLHIEEMLEDVSLSERGWSIVCLRYFNPVGAHESGLIGENPIGIPNNLMPYIAQVATGQLPKLSIYGDDYPTVDGTGVRDYIHVMDLAEGHAAALAYLTKSAPLFLVLNLGTGSGCSVLELTRLYESASKIKIPFEVTARRSGDIAAAYANVDKAFSLLGWKAKRTPMQMCSDSWRWQSSLLQK